MKDKDVNEKEKTETEKKKRGLKKAMIGRETSS